MTTWEARTRGDAAMLAAAAGREVTEDGFGLIQARKPDLDRWAERDGSQNYRPPAEAALGNADWLRRLVALWRRDGWRSREMDSPLYGPVVDAALVLAHAQSGDPALREALRAIWTLYAFRALPSTPRQFTGHGAMFKGNSGKAKITLHHRFYPQGVWVAMAGDRTNPAALGMSLVGPMLAWVLDLPRDYKRYEERPAIPLRAPRPGERELPCAGGQTIRVSRWDAGWQVPLHVMGLLLRGGNTDVGARYGDSLAGNPHRTYLGLTDHERDVLRAVVGGHSTTSIEAAEEAYSWIRDLRVHPGRRSWRCQRTERGVEAAVETVLSGNKPGLIASSYDNGRRYEVLVPSHWRGVGVPKPRDFQDNKHMVCISNGKGERYCMTHLAGDLQWSIKLLPQGEPEVGGRLGERLGKMLVPVPASPPAPGGQEGKPEENDEKWRRWAIIGAVLLMLGMLVYHLVT